MENEGTPRNNTRLLHLGWTVAVLLAVIVVLVTVKWGSHPALADRLNFAAAVASLILAVLAIIYAYISNDSISTSAGQLRSAADSLTANTARFDGSINDLNLAIRGGFKDVKDQISGLKEQEQGAPAGVQGAAPAITQPLAARFVQVSSINGLKLLHACDLSHMKGQAFDLKELCEADKQMSFDYAFGYLVATNSVGLLFNSSTGNVVKIDSFDPLLHAELGNGIKARIAFLRQQGQTDLANHFEAEIAKLNVRFS